MSSASSSGPMPALFVGHGSPMNAIQDSPFRRGWQEVAGRLPRPKAILCVSAHWETEGVYVGSTAQPDTIHDFRGFPKALFEVKYPAPGSPELAHRVAELVESPRVHLDPQRGLDHGAWSVLTAMYPEADVPVLQLSLHTLQPGAWHYDLARQLQPLRDEGVLVMGSGNIVHNLRYWRPDMAEPYDWAARFDEDIAERIAEGHHEGMLGYETLGQDALLAIPTPEHYLPLVYVLALQREGEPVAFFNDQVSSSISMRSVLIGKA